MKTIFLIIYVFLLHFLTFAQQETEPIEIFLIDAYATPELPHTFVLSFFTSEPAITKVILEKKYTYEVSSELSEIHNISIDLTHLEFDNRMVKFSINITDSGGNEFVNDEFDFDLPFEPKIESGSSLLTLCLFGGMIFALPVPGYVHNDSGDFFSLTKEIPIISFRSKSFNYPAGYLAIEYTYIFNSINKNYFRAGYKRLIELKELKYFSPGITAFTNFFGQNGISPEISLGLFTIFNNTFTVYSRYRYNYKPGDSGGNFHEVNLGLYSGFFSFYLK